MSKSEACFYCRNCGESEIDKISWRYNCKLGIDNTGFDDAKIISEKCQGFNPRNGFQMGGYYTHMWFERGDKARFPPPEGGETPCLEWIIQGDLKFPIPNNVQREPTRIHICDFTQIESWVEFWGKELRKRGWISKDIT